jgi:hypothetical protein
VGQMSRTRRVTISLRSVVSTLSRISDRPNSPMITATSSKPPIRFTEPKVKRSMPETGSMPTDASSRPNASITRLRSVEPSDISSAHTRPSTISEKYSGGPKPTASFVSSGEKKVIATRLSVPATNDPIAAIPSAAPARPLRAIWCPSMQVTTEAASPGMLTRIEVVEPPYIAP